MALIHSKFYYAFFYVLFAASVTFLFLYTFQTTEKIFAAPRTMSPEAKVTKTILLWNPFFRQKDYNFGTGSQPFVEHNCTETDCYITYHRDLMSVEQFDAVVFHGGEYYGKTADYPSARSPHQRFVYLSMEAPANRPAYSSLNGVFNTTVTYRLDSDIPLPYFHMEDTSGRVMSPSFNPEWREPILNATILQQFQHIFDTKSKPVAWFVSHCKTQNKRELYVEKLNTSGISVDIYGSCGRLKCPRSNEQYCYNLIRKDYFFYLSFENANCKDYITEKVLNALDYDAIPVLYGGAEVNRFLPPMSYIDATRYTPLELSVLMKKLMNNSQEYLKYFWWKQFYRRATSESPFCTLCQMLHNQHIKPKVYDNFQTWWHGNNSDKMCKVFEIK